MRALTILLLILVLPAAAQGGWPPQGVECKGEPGFMACTGFTYTQGQIELKPAPGTTVSGAPTQISPPLTPPPVVYQVNAKPFLDQFLWPMISVLGFAVVAYIGKILVPVIGAPAAKVVEDRLAKLMQEGLQHGQMQLANSNIERFDVQSSILAKALNYVGEHGAADLKKAGITDEALKARLQAMLAPAVMVATAQAGDVTVAQAATQANPAIATTPVNVNNKE